MRETRPGRLDRPIKAAAEVDGLGCPAEERGSSDFISSKNKHSAGQVGLVLAADNMRKHEKMSKPLERRKRRMYNHVVAGIL
ncbi:hypothetical protein ElyMa_002479000 [Elysia marginata]|uniref:Uncharacterized protein n=1 Tax=Elysia marginata TaxID=1093978 RepID=A0AAV4GRD1_9GAST|nr:hypothetical protein ElyMa_002479000 [Elysia marginata]